MLSSPCGGVAHLNTDLGPSEHSEVSRTITETTAFGVVCSLITPNPTIIDLTQPWPAPADCT